MRNYNSQFIDDTLAFKTERLPASNHISDSEDISGGFINDTLTCRDEHLAFPKYTDSEIEYTALGDTGPCCSVQI